MMNSHLPIQILFEILIRLPVDSLLRCSGVCKAWKSIISDPHFVKAHLRTSSTHITTHRIVFISRTNLHLRTCSLRSVLHDRRVDTADIAIPDPRNRSFSRIVGSCNGLLCIAGPSNALSILNLSTKRSKALCFSSPEGSNLAYGFGYDCITDDYKAAVVIYGKTSCVSLYSLRRNSWRTILDFPYRGSNYNNLDSSGKFTNGALHWGFCSDTSYKSWVIVCLDLGSEKYREVSQPNYGGGEFALEVGVLRGCLCVLCDFQGFKVDIWVMEEYGKRESWRKLVCVPYKMDPRWLARYSNPLWVLDKGEVLMEFRNHLVVYDPEKKRNTVKYVNVRNFDALHEVYSYVESLVSPLYDNS